MQRWHAAAAPFRHATVRECSLPGCLDLREPGPYAGALLRFESGRRGSGAADLAETAADARRQPASERRMRSKRGLPTRTICSTAAAGQLDTQLAAYAGKDLQEPVGGLAGRVRLPRACSTSCCTRSA